MGGLVGIGVSGGASVADGWLVTVEARGWVETGVNDGGNVLIRDGWVSGGREYGWRIGQGWNELLYLIYCRLGGNVRLLSRKGRD